VAQPLTLAPQIILGGGLQAVRVLDERAQLREARLRRGRVLCELVVAPAGGRELAPDAAQLGAAPLLLVAGERVEQVELVRRPRESALLELARHGDQPFGRGGHVLAGGAPAPGIGARSTVGEDTAREDEAVLVLGAQLGEGAQLVVVEEPGRRIELGLDVRLVAVRPDKRRVAAGAEQQPDRLGEDRLAGAGLAGDGVEPGTEGELGPADEDEVVDAQVP
jgi:hypothetical protein